VDIDINGFTFPVEVVVMEMRGLDKVQMILWRPFLATAQAIINVDRWEIIIRSREEYITYKVSGQYCYPKQYDVLKEEPNLKVEEEEENKEHEGQGLPGTS